MLTNHDTFQNSNAHSLIVDFEVRKDYSLPTFLYESRGLVIINGKDPVENGKALLSIIKVFEKEQTNPFHDDFVLWNSENDSSEKEATHQSRMRIEPIFSTTENIDEALVYIYRTELPQNSNPEITLPVGVKISIKAINPEIMTVAELDSIQNQYQEMDIGASTFALLMGKATYVE